MSEASRTAFRNIIKELPERIASVYDCIKRIEATGIEATLKNVAFMMKVEKNVISGRFTDPQDEGLIIDSGVKVGRYTVWQTVDPDHVLDLRKERADFKFKSDIRNFLHKWENKLDSSVLFNLGSYL